MPRRIFEVDGEHGEVEVSGRVTQYVKDEFGLVFTRCATLPWETRAGKPRSASSVIKSYGIFCVTLSHRGQRRRWDTSPDYALGLTGRGND